MAKAGAKVRLSFEIRKKKARFFYCTSKTEYLLSVARLMKALQAPSAAKPKYD